MILALTLVSAYLIAPAYAATDQGFDWGISPSDSIDYKMIVIGEEGVIFNEDFYMEVDTTLPTIPDSMDNWTDIPFPSMDGYWDNGTAMGLYGLVFIYAGNFFLPIGNWGLLTTLVETRNGVDDISNVVVEPNTDVYWGYTSEGDTSDENTSVLVEVSYTKSDGALAWYTVQFWNVTTGIRESYITVQRDDLPFDEDLPATDQGLYWGISTGDIFNYTLTSTDDTTNVTEGIQIEVGSSIPPLLNEVNDWFQIDYPEVEITWLNGTSIGLWAFVLVPAGNLFLPMGNWSLMDSLAGARTDIYDFTLDASNTYYWGYSYKIDGINPNETAIVHVDFLKSDGGLAHYSLEVINATTSATLATASLVREGLPTTSGGFTLPSWITDNILYIGIGVVVLIVALIYFKKR